MEKKLLRRRELQVSIAYWAVRAMRLVMREGGYSPGVVAARNKMYAEATELDSLEQSMYDDTSDID